MNMISLGAGARGREEGWSKGGKEENGTGREEGRRRGGEEGRRAKERKSERAKERKRIKLTGVEGGKMGSMRKESRGREW